MNNKIKQKTTSILTMTFLVGLLMISLNVVPYADAVEGDLLLTLTNPLTDDIISINFGGEIASTLDGDIVVGMPQYNTGDINQGSVAGIVIILDGITGELLLTIDNPSSTIDYFGSDVEIIPNGNLLVSASGYNEPGAVYLFDANTGELLLTIDDHVYISNNGDYIGVTPNGDIILGSIYDVASTGGSVYLFDGTTGNILLQIDNPSGDANGAFGVSVTSTPNGDLLISTSSNDDVNAVYLYDGTTGEQLLAISPPNGSWRPSITTNSDGNLIIGDRYDEFIYLFDGTTGDLLLTIESPDSETIHLGWDIEITEDDNILTSNEIWATDHSLGNLFDGETGELLLSIENPNKDLVSDEGIISQAAITDGKLILSIGYGMYSNYTEFDGAIYVFEGLSEELYCDQPESYYDNVLIGTDSAEILTGTSQNDLILGLGGDDSIKGGVGDDCIYGGDGNDTILANAGNDTIYGESGNDSLFGNNGVDTIYGGEGNDIIWGQAGSDTINAGDGSDICMAIATDTVLSCEITS